MSSRLPLDLYAEVTTADGTRYKFDANQPPGSRLQNFSFRTKIGEGFSDAGGQLSRRIDQDYPDLNLVDTWTFTGADGSVAYEGRCEMMPRDLSDRHVIGVTLAGFMVHAKERMFQEIYVDRDAGQWGDIPLTRRAALATGGISFGDFSFSSNGLGGISAALPNQALGTQTLAETYYRAPTGTTVATVGYKGSFSGSAPGYVIRWITSDDLATLDVYTATFDATLRSQTLTTPRRYAGLEVYSNGTAATPSAGTVATAQKVAVYGNHGLTTHAGDPTEPDGLYLSDILKNIAQRYCPQLDTSGVQDNTYIVQHCAFRDPIFPYDAFLELNKYALGRLEVWEGKRLLFQPYDLTDYDWEIRTDDPGTTFSPQGPSTDDLWNGIAVTYTDPLTGVTDRLTPDVYPTLQDPSSTNPWNTHGVNHWEEITLSTPTLQPQALQLGVAALADRNRAKTPGTITTRGYIRDRAGNPQPCWKVRAGDTISVTNFPNDTPRLIVETDYDDEQKQVRLSIDKPFALLDAYLDRLGNAVGARGLA